MYSWAVSGSVTASNSFGEITPWVNFWPATTSSPTLTITFWLYNVVWSVTPASFSIEILCLPLDSSIAITLPVFSAIVALPFGVRASNNSSTLGRPWVISASPPWATPPEWNVRIVNCVPGSPIDCAAITPTASPVSTRLPVARLRP